MQDYKVSQTLLGVSATACPAQKWRPYLVPFLAPGFPQRHKLGIEILKACLALLSLSNQPIVNCSPRFILSRLILENLAYYAPLQQITSQDRPGARAAEGGMKGRSDLGRGKGLYLR